MAAHHSPAPAAAPGGLRIAVVNSHPIQYFAPFYAYMTRSGIDVTGIYLSDFSLKGGYDPGFKSQITWDIDLLSGYTPKFMGKRASQRKLNGFFSMVAPELWGEITKGRFDALVIHGHNLAAHHVALAAALASGTPVFTRGETHLRLKRVAWKQSVRTPLLKAWYRAFDGCLAIGSANSRYYEAMGVPKSKIFRMPYTVDNDRFIAASAEGARKRTQTREQLGMSATLPAILYAAKFDKRKHPDDLLAAFAQLQQEGIDAQLVLVGSGELEAQLRQMVEAMGVRNVVFPGFINQQGLPDVYAACDLFVLPSDNEPWGLAVNEAMCAGLPVILSDEIGCVDDLVAPGVNGATFTAGDRIGLAAALKPFLVDPDFRARASAASLARIRTWSYAESAAGARAAVETARARRGMR